MKKYKFAQSPTIIAIESLKSSGVKCSRKELFNQGMRFYNENKDVLNEGKVEMHILNMKRFYKRKGWSFPPRKANSTLASMINGYYGKELVESI